MKIRTIGEASLVATTMTTLLLGCGLVFSKVSLVTCLVICLLVFIGSYYWLCYVIKKFVVYRIKPLYQVAFSKDLVTKELENELVSKPNFMNEVEYELSHWAEDNRKEIHRLKKNDQYRKEFAGDVFHEMKTPIFNVQGYILTLLDGGIDDPSINRKYLERADKSIDRLINIITDLEQISKLESGVLLLKCESFDVVALAKEIMDTTEFEAVKRNITVRIINDDQKVQIESCMVMADKRYVGQVFVNLLTNSIKYGKKGGDTRILFIDMIDKIMIEVSDNGVGISKADVPRVFERFYRTDKSRSREQGGTGLGLSIVKHIMEAHNESIKVRSVLGKGSTFSFVLNKSI